MAKPTKHATLICIIMTIVAIIGITLGIILLKPIIVVACLLPAVVYEVYRTEGGIDPLGFLGFASGNNFGNCTYCL